MARHILGKKDKETNGKKDKKRRKKASSSESSDDDVPEEPEVTQEEIEEQLQIQLSLKQRHLKLKSAVKYEDLTCAAGLHIGWGACIVIGFILGVFSFSTSFCPGAEEQISFLIAESHVNLGSLTTMDLSEVGGEYYSVCMKDFEASKLVGKKLRQADKHDKQTATIAQKALALATKKWKNRLLQLFEMPVYQFQILRF